MLRVEELRSRTYEERMEDLKERINAMVHYVTSFDTCRSRMLLNYFGEGSSSDCGQCDVCLEKRRTVSQQKSDFQRAIGIIRECLQDGMPHRLEEVRQLPISTNMCEEALRYMAAEQQLRVEGLKIVLVEETENL